MRYHGVAAVIGTVAFRPAVRAYDELGGVIERIGVEGVLRG